MLTSYAFYFLSFLAIFGGLMVILSKKPVYSILFLIVTFFSIAGHFLLLNAQFLAAVHVIVYTGAILVLLLFVIMLLNLNKESDHHKNLWVKFGGVISAGLVFLVIISAIKQSETAVFNAAQYDPDIGTVSTIGKVLFGEFMVPFEVSSILFLSAMVGAVMLGKKSLKTEEVTP